MKVDHLAPGLFSFALLAGGVLGRARLDDAAHVALARMPSGVVAVHVIDYEGHLIPWKRYHGRGLTGGFNKYVKAPLKRLFNIGKEAKLRNVEKLLRDAQRTKYGKSFCRKINNINRLLKQVDPMATGAMNPRCKPKYRLARSVIIDPKDWKRSAHGVHGKGKKSRSGCPPGWVPVSSSKHSKKYQDKHLEDRVRGMVQKMMAGMMRPFQYDGRVACQSCLECPPSGQIVVPNGTTYLPAPRQHSYGTRTRRSCKRVRPCDAPREHVGHKRRLFKRRRHELRSGVKRRQPSRMKRNLRVAKRIGKVAHRLYRRRSQEKKYGDRRSCRRVQPRSQLGGRLMGVLRGSQRVYCTPQQVAKAPMCHYARVRHHVRGKKAQTCSMVQWYQDPSSESGYCVRIKSHQRGVHGPTVF